MKNAVRVGIELGAGSGLPSIYLARLGHSAECTSLPKWMPLIEERFTLNEPISGNYSTQVLEWGNEAHLATLEDS